MVVIWLGVLFVFGGMVFLMYQPIWGGPRGDAERTTPEAPSDTLEPPESGAGFGLKANWPGLVLILLGSILLLVGARL